ncbi:MAG: hypothetical protein ACRDT6_20485 [Micromonosporaceae bacterium]
MDDFITLVRALLLDEFTDFDRRIARLRALRDTDGSAEFLGCCFFLAVRRRFAPDTPIVDIIRFVANTRVVYDLTGTEIDPGTAERLIRSAMGAGDPLADLPQHQIGTLEIVLLHKIIDDAQLYDDEVEDFLQEAQTLAVRWRTEAAVRALEKLGYTVRFPEPEPVSPPRALPAASRRSPARTPARLAS